MTDPNIDKHDQVLAGLFFNLQAMAMQQLGKIQDPRTGEVALDLEGARHTIDILDMLKHKCRVDTPDELLRMMDQTVMDLQLNFMDEMKKGAPSADDADGAEASDAPSGDQEPADDEVTREESAGSGDET